MRVPSYIFKSLESIFYFRMRVPADLQQVFNRTELKKSLRTKNEVVALRRCRQYVAAAESVFESLRISSFRAELIGDNSPTIQPSMSADGNTSPVPTTAREKEKELLSTVFNASKPVAEILEDPPAVPGQQIPSQSSLRITGRELIRLYINEITDLRGREISKGIEKNLLRFLEIVTDKPLDQYTVEDKQLYRDVLQRIPKCVNRTQYRNMAILDIIQTERPASELLSVKTVNMRLIEAATLFNWAVNNGLVDNHPFKRAVLKIEKNDDAERQAISDADIKKIIENLPRSPEAPSLFWIPLLACFGGMRQSEVAQLDGDDIVNIGGTWCIDVNDRGDKRLKNNNAKRIVPVHQALIDAGLVKFAESRHGLKLFEDVRPYKGKYGHQVSKDFAKYLMSIGVKDNGQTFHGIRHSVITKLWSAGIPEAHTAALVGHQRGECRSAWNNDPKMRENSVEN